MFHMVNLRHLAIGTYERMKSFDLPRLLEHNHALKHLEIEVCRQSRVHIFELVGNLSCVQVESEAFDIQLRGKLPFKLNNITLCGEKLKTISRSAFKVCVFCIFIRCRSLVSDTERVVLKCYVLPLVPCKDVQARSLTLRLRNNRVKEIGRNVFQNMGQVRWLQLDLVHNELSSIAEPSTTLYPGTSNSVFLTSIQMSGNPWNCDCTVG